MNTTVSLGKKKKEDSPTTKTCPYCMSEIDIKVTRCPHCTSQLPETDEDKKEETAAKGSVPKA